MIEPLSIDSWLPKWDMHTVPAKQDPYVYEQLVELQKQGLPLLYAALRLGLPEQIDAAVRVLRDSFGYGVAWLRLHKDAKPWSTNLEGIPLPDSEQGKVHYCKVGVIGQSPDGKPYHDGTHLESSGTGRRARDQLRQSNVKAVKIGYRPVAVPVAGAIAILRMWGVGIATPSKIQYDASGVQIPNQRQKWLIEEVPQIDGQPAPEPPPAAAAKKAA